MKILAFAIEMAGSKRGKNSLADNLGRAAAIEAKGSAGFAFWGIITPLIRLNEFNMHLLIAAITFHTGITTQKQQVN